VECERLQGFPDMFTSKGIMNGKVVDMSDTQRYKQMGNAVTVKVIEVIADKMKVLFNE
jgi:DNA (cytosine-5)-methyltransferase 1